MTPVSRARDLVLRLEILREQADDLVLLLDDFTDGPLYEEATKARGHVTHALLSARKKLGDAER